MDEFSMTTPALFFSAISLLMLAYTNRFLALAQVVRALHAQYRENLSETIYGEIRNLRLRLHLIRAMQVTGISSLLLCVLCMFLIYIGQRSIAEIVFGLANVLLIVSLAISVGEIQISVRALDLHLSDVEDLHRKARQEAASP
ncbi:MAG: DUF2721 domain-containing protein [Leptonema illini]|jgi:hypothetical protein|uniref:DUF2721 domain-containing protein n=1 Tax=Leptonema illini TaxID=183 RepID=A0A833LWV5_9LEPT|nr:MAG: DUF2721 domain-containing protein [Leptonema illini]